MVHMKTQFTHLTRLTSHKIVPHILVTFHEFQIYHFLVCFRALKTVGTEKPANPDVSFLFHCTDNQKYFSKYVLRTVKMILIMPTLMGLVLFVSLPAVATY